MYVLAKQTYNFDSKIFTHSVDIKSPTNPPTTLIRSIDINKNNSYALAITPKEMGNKTNF